MAEHAIIICPQDPYYFPTPEVKKNFMEFFNQVTPFPNANGSYSVYEYNEPHLIDCGEAFEAVICSNCNTNNSTYEMEDEADDLINELIHPINKDHESIVMPCCGQIVKRLDLKFYDFSTYARFAVSSLEPSRSKYWLSEEDYELKLKPETIKQFETILNCPVFVFWSIP